MDFEIFKLHHRGQECLGVRLSREDSRNAQVRSIQGIKWSQTNRCWYAGFCVALEDSLRLIFGEISAAVGSGSRQEGEESAAVSSGSRQEVEEAAADDLSLSSLEGGSRQDFVEEDEASVPLEYSDYSAPEEKTPRAVRENEVNVQPLPEGHLQDLLKFRRSMEVERYAANTIENYVKAVELILRYYSSSAWRTWSQNDIEIFFKTRIIDRKLSWSYQNTFVSALKAFFEVHNVDDMVIHLKKRPRRPKTLPKVLSMETIKQVIGLVKNQKHRTMLSLLYGCGLRSGDLLNMKFSDIDQSRGLINIKSGKGNKDRTVPISVKLIESVNAYYKMYKPINWLFEGQDAGKRYSERSLQEVFKSALLTAGVKEHFTTHCLRHSYATHIMEAGTSTRVIQEILGHKNSKTTEIYTHVSKTFLQRVKSPFDDLDI